MKPINIGGHSAYQDRVLTQLRKYYPDAANSLSSSTWQILEKFWCLDLSAIDVLMQDRYSDFGPEPRLPSNMLRSILVSVEFKITSYTRFASDMASCLKLWEIFNSLFLQKSAADSLISLKELSLAGDGTPVYTAAQERKTRSCNCLDKGIRDCKYNRIYHQPDCDIGWDSHRNRFYFGYDLYMLTASDSKNDLPGFLTLLSQNLFLTQRMMRCLIMITVKQMESLHLLILMEKVEDLPFIKMIFHLIRMVFRCVLPVM